MCSDWSSEEITPIRESKIKTKLILLRVTLVNQEHALCEIDNLAEVNFVYLVVLPNIVYLFSSKRDH